VSNCCASAGAETAVPGTCPACGKKGRQVDRLTLKALLRPQALARLAEAQYSFCRNPECSVVYFTDDTASAYYIGDLKVRVGIKAREDPIPICYCFGHTRAGAWAEIQETGTSTLLASIRAHIQAGRCGCEVNNPSGACCLGEVTQVVRAGLERWGTREMVPTDVAPDCCALRTPKRSRVVERV
jgi:hypothetical protein